MKSITVRALSNDSAEVMRRVEQGESYTITRHGNPVAYLTPLTRDGDLRCVKPATKKINAATIHPVGIEDSTSDVLDDLRT